MVTKPPTLDRRESPVRTWCEGGLSAMAALAVCLFFHWTVKSAGGFNPPGDEDYYTYLVQGWRSGHLYMSKAPHPAMHTLADPYDPAQNAPYRLADASYFKGRNYLYFGAAPALLVMLPYEWVTGKPLGTTTTIFAVVLVGFLSASLALYQVKRRWFPGGVVWVVSLGILVLGCCSHVLALQRRPLVWELPIASAYGCSMLTMLLVVNGLIRGWSRLWLLPGLAFGAAIASRPIYVLGAVAFIPLLWHWWRNRRDRKWPLAPVAWAAAGVTVWMGAIFAYNHARFGHALEFGQNYQLTSVYESKMEHFAARYVPHNAAIYFTALPRFTRHFPFVTTVAVDKGPPGYLGGWNEAVCGAFISFPILLTLFFVPWVLRREAAEDEDLLRVFVACVGFFAVAMTATVLGYFLATPRYMADFMPSLAFLSALGVVGIGCGEVPWALRRIVSPLVVVLAVGSVGFGILLSFDYHRQIAKVTAPEAWKRLEEALNPK